MRHLRFTEDRESIGILADRAAEKMPDGTISIDTPTVLAPELGTTLDYPTLAGLIADASGWLHAAGVRAGDHVAVTKKNHFDIVVLGAAAVRLGAVPALLSGGITPEDAKVVLSRLGPSTVIADRGVIDGWGLFADGTPAHRVVSIDGRVDGAVPLDDLRGATPPPPTPPDPSAPMIITHTSGTTGVPKMVQHSSLTIAHRAKSQTMPWPVASYRRRDRYASLISWTHARAFDGFTAILHVGCQYLAMSDADPEHARKVLLGFRPTVMEALPNVFLLWEPMIQATPDVFGQSRIFISAFDAIHPRTARIMLDASEKKMPIVLQAYGQSEAGGITADGYTRRTVRKRDGRTPTLRSMGWALPGIAKVRVIDVETGEPLGRGKFGEFEVASKGLAMTYYGQEELYNRRRRGEWWTMGDVGIITKSGRALLYDREIDLVPGVDSCLELEDRLLDDVPQITEIVIVALDGQAVPVVSTHGDEPLDREAWAAATADLPMLAPPLQLPWEAIPRTATYKVRRRHLVAQLEADRARRADGSATPEPAVVGEQ